MPDTTAVAITLTLDSSSGGPPYNFLNPGGCAGVITYDDRTTSAFSGWTAEGVGTPAPGGAAFSLTVVDSSYAVNQTGIANWALTFIPRPGTSQASPFLNNENTIVGSGASGQNGTFSLDSGNVQIKNAGTWDWTLVVQITFGNGQLHCFASDPEMDVGP